MTPEQIAHIMALVDHYGSAIMLHDFAEMKRARAAIEAALLAPQQAEPPEIDYEALIAACYKRTKAAQGTKGCVQFAAGAEWYREQIAARPSAPTAVEPLFAAMIAQHPGLREEMLAESERADFEAWAGSITALAKENGEYVEVMTSLAWEAWQARASKGTPL